MGIIDNIHKGKLQFDKNDFILMEISFSGNLFLDGNVYSDNNNISVYYGITGEIKLFIDTKIEIAITTSNSEFVKYKIIGEDAKYSYIIDVCFFNSCNFILENGKWFHRYGGKITGELIITDKNSNYEPTLIVCDCIGSNIPCYHNSISINGIEILITENRNYLNNREFIDRVFKNILGTTFQHKPVLPIHNNNINKIYHNIELLISFLSGHDFGISIIKFLNGKDITKYIVKDKYSVYNNNHFILNDDIEKIKKLVEKTNLIENFVKEYFRETINSLAKLHNETDIIIKWAVLIMAIERFLFHVLIENNKLEKDLESTSVIQKIGMYNKILRDTTGKVIPKEYYRDEILRIDYRNPLFHYGDFREIDIDKIFFSFMKYLDFFYQIILNYVGYDDEIILMSKNYKFGKLF